MYLGLLFVPGFLLRLYVKERKTQDKSQDCLPDVLPGTLQVQAVHAAQGKAMWYHVVPRQRGLHLQDLWTLRKDARRWNSQALHLSTLWPSGGSGHRSCQEHRHQVYPRQSVNLLGGFKKADPRTGSGVASYRLARMTFVLLVSELLYEILMKHHFCEVSKFQNIALCYWLN